MEADWREHGEIIRTLEFQSEGLDSRPAMPNTSVQPWASHLTSLCFNGLSCKKWGSYMENALTVLKHLSCSLRRAVRHLPNLLSLGRLLKQTGQRVPEKEGFRSK